MIMTRHYWHSQLIVEGVTWNTKFIQTIARLSQESKHSQKALDDVRGVRSFAGLETYVNFEADHHKQCLTYNEHTK